MMQLNLEPNMCGLLPYLFSVFINHAAKCNVTAYKIVLSERAKKKASCHYTYYVSSVEVHNRWNHQFHMLWKRICTTLNKVLNLAVEN